MFARMRSRFAAAAVSFSAAGVVALGGATPADAAPHGLGAPVELPTTTWIANATFDTDGSVRLLDFAEPPRVWTIPAVGATGDPQILFPGAQESPAQAVLTPAGASYFYAPSAGTLPGPLTVRDVALDGSASEAVMGRPGAPLGIPVDVSVSTSGSIAVVATRKRQAALLYRPAGATAFSTNSVLLGSVGDTREFAFLPDGSALLTTLSEYVKPTTFQRVRRDGTVSRPMLFGKSRGETLAVDTAVSPRGAVAVAELQTRSPTSPLADLRVAELKAGATRFGRVRTIGAVPLNGESRVVLGRGSGGTLTALVSDGNALRVYRGSVAKMRPSRTFSAPSVGEFTVTTTDDGETYAFWTAQRSSRSVIRRLLCTRWANGSGWSTPGVIASARATIRSEDEGGGNPGLSLQVAKPWPGGGVGIVYRIDGENPTGEYLRRVPAGGC